jgi:hypothetical protein
VLVLPINEQGTPKCLQPGGEKPHIVPDGAQDGVDGIAISTLEMVSFKQAVTFKVPDNRFGLVTV